MNNTELYPHQREALKQTEGLNRVAYYFDMGLGKTFIGSEKLISFGNDLNLIICQKSKVSDWIDHFRTNYGFFELYDLTDPKDFEHFIFNVGKYSMIGVINYELAWRRPELLKLTDFTLLLDESSVIQNTNAKRTKFILKMDPKNVILLSGTPTSGKYENLYSQLHLLGWKISEDLYNRQYVNWKKIEIPGGRIVKVVDKLTPYKNVERLKAKMKGYGSVFKKTEECFNLPEQTFIDIRVPKSKEYKTFMKRSIVTIGDIELVGDTNFTKRIYSRELCGSYSEEKFEAFRDILNSTNDRLIVFYNFNDELTRLIKIVNESGRKCSIVNGSVKMLEQYYSDPDSVTLIQYQSGSMGLNLQKANKAVYFSPPERCELWMQSKKRIHRIGQEKPCFYYQLIVEGSVEEQIYKALERGVDFTNDLFVEGGD